MTAVRIGRAATAAAALCLVLATSVTLGFDSFRAKVVQGEPRLPAGDIVRVPVHRGELAPALRSPIAVIARVENDGPAPQQFAITVDGRTICSTTVPPGQRTHRIDCAYDGDHWNAVDNHDIAVASNGSTWKLAYLELATHHGATRGYDLVVVPRPYENDRQPSPLAIALAFGVFTVAFLLPGAHLSFRWTIVSRVAAGAAALLLVLVSVSPLVSNYRVLLSSSAFVDAVVILAFPRLWRAFLWMRHEIRTAWRPAATCLLCGTVVFVVFSAVFVERLSNDYHWNYSGFLKISGDVFDRNPIVNHRIDVRSSVALTRDGGYDGQFPYFMTFDPFLRRFSEQPETYNLFIDAPPYRFGRIGFSVLTKLLSLNRWQLYPAVMMWLILGSLFACGWILAATARVFGASPAYGLLIVLVPGFWQSLEAGLPEPVAAALLLAGYFCLSRERPAWASVLFATSLLVRETGAILVAALVAGLWFRGQRRAAAVTALLSFTPLIAWRLYIGSVLYPTWGIQAFWYDPHDIGPPFAGLAELWRQISHGQYYATMPEIARAGIWYPLVLACGLGAAIAVALSRLSATAAAAVMYGLLAISLTYDSIWVHVGNGQRGTYELFIAMALTSIGMRAYPRRVQTIVSGFWVLAAVYVFGAGLDADYIRHALFLSTP